MRVIRTYEVTISQEILDDLEARGFGSGGLIDACTRYHDCGEDGTLYLTVNVEFGQDWKEAPQNWTSFPLPDQHVLYTVKQWDCKEVGWTVG